MIVGPTIIYGDNKTIALPHFSSPEKISSSTTYCSICDRLRLNCRIYMKESLTEMFYEYCFLIGKKCVKMFGDSKLKYSKYI